MNMFTQIDNSLLMEIDGGLDVDLVLGGTALLITCIGAAAACPAAPLLYAGALCAGSALSGYTMGLGIVKK